MDFVYLLLRMHILQLLNFLQNWGYVNMKCSFLFMYSIILSVIDCKNVSIEKPLSNVYCIAIAYNKLLLAML